MGFTLGIVMLILSFSLAQLFFVVLVKCEITIEDNGYGGIVVAIDAKVPESDELLNTLKESLSEASELLYSATRNQVYFREILIQLPSTWETNNTALLKSYATGDFIVDTPPPLHGDRPFTMQPFGCGEPGDFTVLPPDFFNDTSEQTHGPLSKVIVHEWGHLRFGLFDEYPVRPEQKFYSGPVDANGDVTVEGTRCSGSLEGKIRKADGITPCTATEAFSANSVCEFFDNAVSEQFYASLMYKTNLQHIDQFCDNNQTDEKTLHNIDAKTDQNALCEKKSAWEVFRKHPDFGPSPATYTSPPETQFITYKIRRPRTILVMDVSGSMGNKINTLAEAVTLYLTQFVRDDEEVGLVQFDTTAKKLHDLTVVSPSTRDQLVDKVPTSVHASTCIGCGIQVALQMLNPAYVNGILPDSNKGGTIIVLSDGVENQGPRIYEVHDEVIKQSVALHSIALTDAADSNVDALAIASGGKTFIHSSFDGTTNALTEAFQTLNDNDANPYDKNIQLMSEIEKINPGGTYEGEVMIDSSVGRDTKFIFDYDGNDIGITLEAPDASGTTYTETDADNSSPSKIYVFSITDDVQQNGTWKYTITNNDATSTHVAITVTSRASSPERPPIIAEPFWSHRDGDPRIQTRNLSTPILYVRVSQGYSPVVGAIVKAFITTPDRPSGVEERDLILIDKGGTEFDTYAGDGIYANYFLPRNGIGRYEVRIWVGTNEVTSIDHRRIIGHGAPTDDPDPDAGKEATGDFQRVVNLGAYNVVTEPAKQDPSRITSLTVVSVDTSRQILVLEWTATGAELNFGTASYYSLRYSTNYAALRDDFSNQLEVEADQIVRGDLGKPKEAGQKELFILNYPASGDLVLYYAVVAYDTDSRTAQSAVSNIEKATLVIPQAPPAPAPTIPPTTQPDTESPTTEAPSTPLATTLLSTPEVNIKTDKNETDGTSIQTQPTEAFEVTYTQSIDTDGNLSPGLLTDSNTKLGLIIGVPLTAVCVTLVIVIICAVMHGNRKRRRRQRKTRYFDYENPRVTRGYVNHAHGYSAKHWKQPYMYA